MKILVFIEVIKDSDEVLARFGFDGDLPSKLRALAFMKSGHRWCDGNLFELFGVDDLVDLSE